MLATLSLANVTALLDLFVVNVALHDIGVGLHYGAAAVLHADDDDTLSLWPLRLLDKLVHVVQIAGEQHEWAFQPKGCGSHDSIDGTSVARQPSRPEQLTSLACDLGGHRHDSDSG